MERFQSFVKKAIDHLETAAKAIQAEGENIPEAAAQLSRLTSLLKNESNRLHTHIGLDVATTQAEPLQRVTTMFGREISKETENATEGKTHQEVAGEDLNRDIERYYRGIADLTDTEVLDAVPELTLRGIAVRAGLPFTEGYPERIGVMELGQIRQAIVKADEIEAANASASVAESDEGLLLEDSPIVETNNVDDTAEKDAAIEDEGGDIIAVDEDEIAIDEVIEDTQPVQEEKPQPEAKTPKVKNARNK